MFKFLFNYSNKEAKLPSNRIDQFGYIMRFYWRQVALVSLLTLLFAIPFVAWMIVSNMANNVLYNSYLSADDETKLQLAEQIRSQIFVSGLISVPLVGLSFVGLSGAAQVMKKYIWREIVDLSTDFWGGIKKHWLGSLIIGCIYALFLTSVISSNLFSESIAWTIVGAVIVVFATIWAFYCFFLNVFYVQKLHGLLFNALILTILRFPQNLIIFLFSCLTLTLFFLPTILATALFVLINGMIGFGYSLLLATLNAQSSFDKYINKQSYPEYYKKGLAKAERFGSDTNV